MLLINRKTKTEKIISNGCIHLANGDGAIFLQEDRITLFLRNFVKHLYLKAIENAGSLTVVV